MNATVGERVSEFCTVKEFKDLKAWQLGKLIATEVCRMSDGLGPGEQAVFTTQVSKAAVSIPSRIAEGNSKRTNKDYGRFIEVALGAAFELETHLIIMRELGVGDAAKVEELIALTLEEQKLLYGLLRKLNHDYL